MLLCSWSTHLNTTLNTVCVFRVLKEASPLRARGLEHRGQQASVQRRHLGDVQRLAPVAALLHILPQAGAAGAVTQGAGQVATAPRRHGCGGLDGRGSGAGKVGGRGRLRRQDSSALRRRRKLKFLENKTFTFNDAGFYLDFLVLC